MQKCKVHHLWAVWLPEFAAPFFISSTEQKGPAMFSRGSGGGSKEHKQTNKPEAAVRERVTVLNNKEQILINGTE